MSGEFETYGEVSPVLSRSIERLIDNDTISTACYRHTTASTNQDAIEELKGETSSSLQLPRLYLCDHQTAGRGRQGNTWHSVEDSLTFSLAMTDPRSEPQFPLSLIVGVAVARAIEFLLAPVRVGLKWPNDLYVDGGKVGGILIESAGAHPNLFVIGIGINVDTVPSIPSRKLSTNRVRPNPESLSRGTGRTIDRKELLVAMIESIVETVGDVDVGDTRQLSSEYRERCVLECQPISLLQPDGNQILGQCRGIDDAGRLVVETESGDMRFQTGEANLIRAR